MSSNEKQAEIENRLTERVQRELDKIDTAALYAKMIDECYSFEGVGGPFAGMSPARVLEKVDPTAYRCGKTDWEDSMSRDEWEEIGGDYYDRREVKDLRDEVEAEIDAEMEEAEEAEDTGEAETDPAAV